MRIKTRKANDTDSTAKDNDDDDDDNNNIIIMQRREKNYKHQLALR
jgi:hypothetical protein